MSGQETGELSEQIDNVTILQADISGFTKFADHHDI